MNIVSPRILDLFCCAGGAGMGYARAGFDVTGVDVVQHKNNPHPVIEADALSLDPEWIAKNFDAVHASPPCQGYTLMRHAPGAKGAPRLIRQTRELLQATGLPWVLENVEAAEDEMLNPVTLCGTMFGLGAQEHDLLRHRLFETSFSVTPLDCKLIHQRIPSSNIPANRLSRRAPPAASVSIFARSLPRRDLLMVSPVMATVG
jgi:DNA (cytosine-5)-methyltransferase 1